MKGPSLRYDLRVLRVFQCDACGRQTQAPAAATTRTCACSDPPKFMRPLERAKVTPPDVTRFLSPPDPVDLVEEELTVEEPYVPFIPQLPPRPVQFPRRRKLYDEPETVQPPEFGVGVGGSADTGEKTDVESGESRAGQDRQSQGSPPPRERTQRHDREASRTSIEKRDRNRQPAGQRFQRHERPKKDRHEDVAPADSDSRPAGSSPPGNPALSDAGVPANEQGNDAVPVRRHRRRGGRDGRPAESGPTPDPGGDDFGSGLESSDSGGNNSGSGDDGTRVDPNDERSAESLETRETDSGDGSGPSRRGRHRGRRRGRGRESGRGPGNTPDVNPKGGS